MPSMEGKDAKRESVRIARVTCLCSKNCTLLQLANEARIVQHGLEYIFFNLRWAGHHCGCFLEFAG